MTKTQEMKKEIKKNPFFANREVKDEDVLKIMLFLEEKENCVNCKGLEECKNSTNGYESFISDNNLIYSSECKYLTAQLVENRKRQKLKMLYSPQLIDASISTFRRDTENRIKCLKYVTNFLKSEEYYKGAYICGDLGTGKTYLLAVLANELVKKERETIFVYFPDLINDLKDNFSLLNEKLEELKKVDVLIIDDFGVGNMTPWVRDSILAPILNYRMLAYKPLFISSNVKFFDLAKYLKVPGDVDGISSGRLFRRINELCQPLSL